MQATIYVTDEALATATALIDLDHHSRMLLADDEEDDVTEKPGYYLKSAKQMRLAALPHDAIIALRLYPEEPETYDRHVSFPTNLRGCIFAKAPHLPDGYAENVTYWSGPPVNSSTSGAVYFQNPQNEYMVDLSALDDVDSDVAVAAVPAEIDSLLSEGVVICIDEIGQLIAGLALDHFVEVKVPVIPSMVGIEPDDFRSTKDYLAEPSQRSERIFLQIVDIVRSPDCNRVFVDLLRHELITYGYWY